MMIIHHGSNIGGKSDGSGYVAINWGEGILTRNRNRLKAVESLSGHYLPCPVRLAAGPAIAILGLATNGDGLLEFPAIAAIFILIGRAGAKAAGVAAIRIIPGGCLAGRICFERDLTVAAQGLPVGPAEGTANAAADGGPGQGSAGNGDDLAGAMTAEGIADSGAANGAKYGSKPFLLSRLAGTDHQGNYQGNYYCKCCFNHLTTCLSVMNTRLSQAF